VIRVVPRSSIVRETTLTSVDHFCECLRYTHTHTHAHTHIYIFNIYIYLYAYI